MLKHTHPPTWRRPFWTVKSRIPLGRPAGPRTLLKATTLSCNVGIYNWPTFLVVTESDFWPKGHGLNFGKCHFFGSRETNQLVPLSCCSGWCLIRALERDHKRWWSPNRRLSGVENYQNVAQIAKSEASLWRWGAIAKDDDPQTAGWGGSKIPKMSRK